MDLRDMRRILLAWWLLLSITCVAERSNFDEGWKFIEGDPSGAEKAEFSDAKWRNLDLPHDWSIEGKFEQRNPSGDRSGYLPTGIGWYRKSIEVPLEWKGKRVSIDLHRAFRNSTVWVNGKELGKRPYGWISFGYDISDHVQSERRITFAVRVDNKLQHAARWYTGSGIYAHTWINVREPIHIPRSGVWIRTKRSKVSIDTEVTNTTASAADCVVRTTILDAEGIPVVSKETPISLKPNETDSAVQTM